MCYDVNPLVMKLHLRDLDRQTGLSRCPRSNILVAPRKTWCALLAMVRLIRDRFGSEAREQEAEYQRSITARPAS